MKVQTLSVDRQKLGTYRFDVNFLVKKDLHLLVEVFDSLCNNEFVDKSLNIESFFGLFEHLQRACQLSLLVVK